MLNPDTLLRVTEAYAEGSFEELFDVQWANVEDFIRAANDYVAKRDRFKFAEAIREAVARGA